MSGNKKLNYYFLCWDFNEKIWESFFQIQLCGYYPHKFVSDIYMSGTYYFVNINILFELIQSTHHLSLSAILFSNTELNHNTRSQEALGTRGWDWPSKTTVNWLCNSVPGFMAHICRECSGAKEEEVILDLSLEV